MSAHTAAVWGPGRHAGRWQFPAGTSTEGGLGHQHIRPAFRRGCSEPGDTLNYKENCFNQTENTHGQRPLLFRMPVTTPALKPQVLSAGTSEPCRDAHDWGRSRSEGVVPPHKKAKCGHSVEGHSRRVGAGARQELAAHPAPSGVRGCVALRSCGLGSPSREDSGIPHVGQHSWGIGEQQGVDKRGTINTATVWRSSLPGAGRTQSPLSHNLSHIRPPCCVGMRWRVHLPSLCPETPAPYSPGPPRQLT